jgi:hypothetical protein
LAEEIQNGADDSSTCINYYLHWLDALERLLVDKPEDLRRARAKSGPASPFWLAHVTEGDDTSLHREHAMAGCPDRLADLDGSRLGHVFDRPVLAEFDEDVGAPVFVNQWSVGPAGLSARSVSSLRC